MNNLPANRKAFTLAEAMIATVILSIAAAGVVLPFANGAMSQAEGERRTLASKLAADLMESIIKTPFSQVIGTYNGYSESQGQVKDSRGIVFSDSNYTFFSRGAVCQSVYVTQESGTGTAKYILAKVRVYYKGRQMAEVNRLISK